MLEARKENILEYYHGTLIADPFRWMEDPVSEETRAWVESQNQRTASFLQAVPARQRLQKRLTELWDYPRYSAPHKEGERYFFWKNDGLQNHAVLYRQASLTGEPRLVIDPNTFSEDGTRALTGYSFSHDAALLAYSVSSSGSDWQEFRVRRLDDSQDLPDRIERCKFSNVAWKHDNSGFYYNRFPDAGTVDQADETNFNRVYWHTLGTSQSEDRLVYEQPADKELGFSPYITEDGRYLVLNVWQGTDTRNRIYYCEVENESGEFIRLLNDMDASYEFIDNDGPVFYFQTDKDAPHGRIIAINTRQSEPAVWREVVPEQADVLSFVGMVDDTFVTAYMHDAFHRLKLYSSQGEFKKELALPAIGSITELAGKRADKELFIGFTSFLNPSSIYRYDAGSEQMTLLREAQINFDASAYEARQVFYTSRDGTRIPMFVLHKRGLELNGHHPTILYGYGGFNISLTPSFSVMRLVWLESGGVFAIANLRGGGEYGEEWHRAGQLENKQNVFDDFTAAAEFLIESGYTSRRRLAIMGGSNGGLLVAACMLQRPDLFGAVLCMVPVTDMLRYHKLTIGRYWIPDYGNAEENPEHFKFLYAYSPLHNVQSGVEYPSTLITTADTDDRVVPAHAKKFAATLLAAQSGPNPVLLRVETKAGHGMGKPTAKVIEEQSDIFAFLFRVFDIAQ